MPIVLLDERDKAELQGQIDKIDETLKTITTPIEVDSIFANNSWKLIKWICQHDDPSKYWKVGDYKMLQMGEKYQFADDVGNTFELDSEYAWFMSDNSTGLNFYNLENLLEKLNYEEGIYKVKTDDSGYNAVMYKPNGEVVENVIHGEDFTYDMAFMYDEWTVKIVKAKVEYPLQIIGFNHDKVINPYEYGKARAGITLQLGCSRNNYGDSKPSLFDGTIEGLMTANGKYYKSPNRVKSDFSDGVTNWRDSGARVAVQTMFDNTEIRPYMVKTQKYTSQYFNSTNRWAAPMLTEDWVSFLSEWEMFGMQVQAPAKEGDQYEFFKDGYSKFMWHKDMLDGKTKSGLLWLRSAQASQVNGKLGDSNSTCCCYLDINKDGTLNYAPAAAASENRSGFIAPCICL